LKTIQTFESKVSIVGLGVYSVDIKVQEYGIHSRISNLARPYPTIRAKMVVATAASPLS
jgi:hypothetical protein